MICKISINKSCRVEIFLLRKSGANFLIRCLINELEAKNGFFQIFMERRKEIEILKKI